MVERFNALVRRGNVDLEVWFGVRTDAERSWTVDESTWMFPYRYLPRIGTEAHGMSMPTPISTSARPDLLVSLYASPAFLTGLFLAWQRGWRTALWVEVTFDSWIRRRRWKEVLKRVVFRRVDAVITAGQDGRAFALRYGVSAERVHIARHVVDVEYFAAGAALTRADRDETRSELGLGGVVFLYVGRLWWAKGIDALLAAYSSLDQEMPGATSLLLVGDGAEHTRIAELAVSQGLRVTLTGFRQRAELPALYAVGDTFVFPSLGDPYGLVVDEAMATGLPVISTTAAGEIRERVVDGVNAYLVPPNDPSSLQAAMRRLAVDPVLRHQMGMRSAAMIAPHTPDRWAGDFEHAVDSILSAARVR